MILVKLRTAQMFVRAFTSPKAKRRFFQTSSVLFDEEEEIDSDSSTYKPRRKVPVTTRRSHEVRLSAFLKKTPHLQDIKSYIPAKYLTIKRITPPDSLYLIDKKVAKTAAKHVLAATKHRKQMICESNPGLGLISKELLEEKIQLVRLYESCSEFRLYLKEKFEGFKGRVEHFNKDIFLLSRYEYIDKQDGGNRVEQMLQGILRKNWDDDPVMTIIGTLPNMGFIRFLVKSLVLQSLPTSLGRVQLFAFLRPRDFIILTAGPEMNLHTYQRFSVIFQLFFDCELLEKFPREVFLPWQAPSSVPMGRYPGQIDTNLIYFVKIDFKKKLPVTGDNLYLLYSFVQQFFGRGKIRVVPALEKWLPGSGLNIIVPKMTHRDFFKEVNIFTTFGELSPTQILAIFKEMITHPRYEKTHFMNLVESELVQSETIETSLDDSLVAKHLDSNEISEQS